MESSSGRWQTTSHKKKEALTDTQFHLQPTLYTSRGGYRLALEPTWTGTVWEGDAPVVVLYGDAREFDSLLQWPFRQRGDPDASDQSGKKNHIMETFKADPQQQQL